MAEHQKSIFLQGQQLHWQNLSDVSILELWSLLKTCNFQGRTWTGNYLNFDFGLF